MIASKTARAGPRMPCSPTAASVPRMLASVAETKATIRLVSSASITKGFFSARPYHWIEKPCSWLAWRPALKLNSAMIAIGV